MLNEAVKQVRNRGVSSAQVARDLGISQNVVSRWVREASGDVRKAFPGHVQQSADQVCVANLCPPVAQGHACYCVFLRSSHSSMAFAA